MINNAVMLNSMGYLTFDPWTIKSIDLPYRRPELLQEIMLRHQSGGILLLEGGADISPSLYGQRNRYSYGFSGRRDSWEIACYEAAREFNIPILGICRGHQLIAALNGGTLYQDITEEYSSDGWHTGGPLVLRDIFAEWYPDGFYANSLHHQAVNQVPENAKVIAYAEDGIIEALLYPDDRMLTVQFHPEMMHQAGAELLEHIVTYFRAEAEASA